jgi:hypothetical protein
MSDREPNLLRAAKGNVSNLKSNGKYCFALPPSESVKGSQRELQPMINLKHSKSKASISEKAIRRFKCEFVDFFRFFIL